MRHASGIGAYGVWGGLGEEERRPIRRPWLAGTSVTECLRDQPARLRRDEQMACHRRHPWRRRGRRPGRGRLVQRMHVPVELGGVVGYVADHALDLVPLILVLDLAVQRDPAVLHPGVDLPL